MEEDKKKKKTIKEEISEIFKIEKETKKEDSEKQPKEKIITTHVEIEKNEEEPSKKEIKKENKILRIVGIILVSFVLAFLGFLIIIHYTTHFEVEGVKFEIVKMGQLTFYKTSLPGIINQDGEFEIGVYEFGHKAEYNIYLRHNPRVLQGKMKFYGDINFKENMVINMGQEFKCNGDGVIAIANLLNVYEVLGISVMKDENATCDEIYGRYLHLNIREKENNEQPSVVSWGLEETCYNLNINECDILIVTEKFLLETLIEVNKKLK